MLVYAGAALGSAFGSVAQQVGALTGYGVVEPQAYALVGVAAMLAGTCQVIMTTMLRMILFLKILCIVNTGTASSISDDHCEANQYWPRNQYSINCSSNKGVCGYCMHTAEHACPLTVQYKLQMH